MSGGSWDAMLQHEAQHRISSQAGLASIRGGIVCTCATPLLAGQMTRPCTQHEGTDRENRRRNA